jgi:hypothetical protein
LKRDPTNCTPRYVYVVVISIFASLKWKCKFVRELFDALKIKNLVLPKLTISVQRSQKLDSASTCLCKPLGVEAIKTKSSTNKSREINT